MAMWWPSEWMKVVDGNTVCNVWWCTQWILVWSVATKSEWRQSAPSPHPPCTRAVKDWIEGKQNAILDPKWQPTSELIYVPFNMNVFHNNNNNKENKKYIKKKKKCFFGFCWLLFVVLLLGMCCSFLRIPALFVCCLFWSFEFLRHKQTQLQSKQSTNKWQRFFFAIVFLLKWTNKAQVCLPKNRACKTKIGWICNALKLVTMLSKQKKEEQDCYCFHRDVVCSRLIFLCPHFVFNRHEQFMTHPCLLFTLLSWPQIFNITTLALHISSLISSKMFEVHIQDVLLPEWPRLR